MDIICLRHENDVSWHRMDWNASNSFNGIMSLVIHNKPFDKVFGKMTCCPLAKLDSSDTSHTITYGKYHLQRIANDIVCLAIRGSY